MNAPHSLHLLSSSLPFIVSTFPLPTASRALITASVTTPSILSLSSLSFHSQAPLYSAWLSLCKFFFLFLSHLSPFFSLASLCLFTNRHFSLSLRHYYEISLLNLITSHRQNINTMQITLARLLKRFSVYEKKLRTAEKI